MTTTDYVDSAQVRSVVELGNNAPCNGILRDSNGCFLVAFASRFINIQVPLNECMFFSSKKLIKLWIEWRNMDYIP
ncbi:hypothetical protein L195_g031570 [Trifolium pratense]|uniref:Uncharacterized protein n=1 Tax=Trifolium pratense TaxID=57577 RepID=A0A2K3LAR6_TRIPR|nr:hypothetical protein L195_g031570 [Trifolium pratense]